ncbi:helix-turn-helix domain-containing protein [Nocardia sp. CA-128927]|uniref:MmyB family transcriptional regulator n=1 Tax=Nocardia sp. CA-128927 TaxID=3239975 RepID=UPI003D98E826
MPRLRTYCWQIRNEMGLSRREADALIGISSSYIGQIETGERVPSFEMVEKIISGYGLTWAQAQHMRELRASPVELIATDQLRADVHQSPNLLAHLADLEDQGVHAVVADPLWNVLAANPSFWQAFPGLGPTDNLLAWYFGPTAKELVIEWKTEALHVVATAKGAVGRHRDSPQARQFLNQMSPDHEFSNIWINSTRIAYGRGADDYLHWREPGTGDPYSLSLQVSEVSEARDVLLGYIFRKPYAGPPLT